MITQSMNADLFHRIMAKVEITDGCWLWRGGMHSRAYYDRKKRDQGEKPIDRLRRLAKRCGFELVPVGKNRWHVVLDMS